jgi:hypothetical protein
MKKLLVCLTVASFALLSVAQADDSKTSDKTASASKAKTKSVVADKSACCATVTSTSAKGACADKLACCSGEKSARRVANPDLKGATFLAKR